MNKKVISDMRSNKDNVEQAVLAVDVVSKESKLYESNFLRHQHSNRSYDLTWQDATQLTHEHT